MAPIQLKSTVLCFAFACMTVMAFAQAPTPPQKGGRPVPPRSNPFAMGKHEIRPYSDVITSKAKTQTGVFKVHQVDDKLYWEIPADMLGRDFLWQTEIAELPQNTGYPGMSLGYKVVEFERHDDMLYLRAPGFDMRAVNSKALEEGVEANSVPPIIQAFNIETEGKDKSVVIDVTNIFAHDQGEMAVGPRIGAAGADPSRSYVERVTAFPENIETRAFLTLNVFTAGDRPTMTRPTASSMTFLVHSSLVLLPEKPMTGRYADSRVGYFTTAFDLYGGHKNGVESKEYINRFRLEKKDPSKAISDPVKPIVFYLSREVPEVYRPYLKKAVEAWQPAFEQAGFSHAILCKDAPSVDEDPTWDPEDARYNVIRWAPSPVENAMGPHISDPRSGETISAHIIIWHNVLELAKDWYFSQAGATDPRAQHLPLSDQVMGELIQYIVTHEVGHTLGLTHNFKASSGYTIAELRDPKFTEANGIASSVMDYTRFNYVAQPGDGAATIGKPGPYDKFAIEWGYKPIPDAMSPDDEKQALDQIAARQVGDPALRFDSDIAAYLGIDPTAQAEDMGDDPIEATRLGLLNLNRIAKILLPATTKFGEDYDDLLSAYSALLTQRSLELRHVARMVGGVVTTDYHAGRGADTYSPVPAERQKEAVKFIMANLEMPHELLNPSVLNKITPSGALKIDSTLEAALLDELMNPQKLQRMLDNEALNGPGVYTVAKLIPDIMNGVWSEVYEKKPRIDVYRESLQLTYLDMMDAKINQGDNSEIKEIASASLQTLAKKIDAAIPRAANPMTTIHLQASRKEIEKILEGKTASSNGLSGPIFLVLGTDSQPQPTNQDCFAEPVFDAVKNLVKGGN